MLERNTMHITQNVEKIRTNYGGKLRNFVSYFQSVTTVGVVTTARNPLEAETLAKSRITDGRFVSGIFNQTPYTLSETEEWKPELSEVAVNTEQDKSNSVNLVLSLGDDVTNKIAFKLNKQPSDINEDDCLQYLKRTLDISPA